MANYYFSFVLLFLLITSSCSSPHAIQSRCLEAYHCADAELAEKTLTKKLGKEQSDPRFQSKDRAWLLLNRATLRLSQGNFNGAVCDYQKAIEAIKYFSQDSSLENISQILFSDESAAYSGDDFEQVLAPIYLSLALLQKGEEANASAILRYAEELQQIKKSSYKNCSYTKDFELVENALGKYLLASICEKKGDLSNANILYKQSYDLSHHPRILCDLKRLENSFTSSKASVIVICHNGNVPLKISETLPASMASFIALECFLGTSNITPAISSSTGFAVPSLITTKGSEPISFKATLSGNSQCLEPIFNVATTSFFELEQKKPVLIAKALARIALRRGLVSFSQHQNETLGALVDIGMFVANLATKADTRSWSTLPAQIDMARFDVDAGIHSFQFSNRSPFFLNLKEGDLCIINIFNIHCGNLVIQVPPQFILEES